MILNSFKVFIATIRDPQTARFGDRLVRDFKIILILDFYFFWSWSGPRTRIEPLGSEPTGFGPLIPGYNDVGDGLKLFDVAL